MASCFRLRQWTEPFGLIGGLALVLCLAGCGGTQASPDAATGNKGANGTGPTGDSARGSASSGASMGSAPAAGSTVPAANPSSGEAIGAGPISGGVSGQATNGAPGAKGTGDTATASGSVSTAQQVLEEMAAAYAKAKTYSDRATLRMIVDRPNQPEDRKVDFSVAFARPNRIKASLYGAKLVCDGTTFQATLADLPQQVLRMPAPAELRLQSLEVDPLLIDTLTRNFGGPSQQILLLVEPDALKMLTQGAAVPEMDQPGDIAGHKCHRVKIRFPDGIAILWIDQATHVLRRLSYPTQELMRQLLSQGPVDHVSIEAEYTDAQIDGPLDAGLFNVPPPPPEATIVDLFLPPHPGQLLGNQVAGLHFTDLQGQPVALDSLRGKIVLLDYWATWCMPCRRALPELEKVYQKYKDHPKVAILAVSVDEAKVPDAELKKNLGELGVNIPILRDNDNQVSSVLHTPNIPSQFLFDGNGVLQSYRVGEEMNAEEAVSKRIDDLLAGKSIVDADLATYKQDRSNYESQVRAMRAGGNESAAASAPPTAAVAPKSDPQTLRLRSLWKNTELKLPGNMLVLNDKQGPRLVVIDRWQSLAELSLDGKRIAEHDVAPTRQDAFTLLRQTTLADGSWRLALFAQQGQRVHLLDDQWKTLWSFPPDALENPHPGIFDVQFGDLAGNGAQDLYVSYAGVVGVQAVSLAGERRAANRSIVNVFSLAVGPQASNGARGLFCATNEDALQVLDVGLQRVGAVTVPGRQIYFVRSADLRTGQLAWLGIHAAKLGENVAVGFDLDGRELWNYPLPAGAPQTPVELATAGRIVPGETTGQWILPGPDGSVHILSPAGKLLDRFNYGALIHGLTTGEIAGRPVLFIASENGVEALQAE